MKSIYLHINSKKGTKKKILTFSCNFPTLSVKNEYSASSISRSNSTPFEAASCKYQDKCTLVTKQTNINSVSSQQLPYCYSDEYLIFSFSVLQRNKSQSKQAKIYYPAEIR